MKAIQFSAFGDADVLQLHDVPDPVLRPTDILVKVAGAGVNRADIGFRTGHYGWADFGDSDRIGLEMAGEVVAVGPDVPNFKVGDRVMGITGGGAYAELARLDYRMVLPVPGNLDLLDAAGIMEVFVTAHEALIHLAQLQPGEWALIHAASGGVGSAAVQLAKARGAKVIFTAPADRIDKVLAIGGDVGVDYRSQDFAKVVAQETGGQGVDVIVDFIGAPNLERNVRAMNYGGRLVQVGIMGGTADAKLPLDLILYRHLHIIGTVMKSRAQEVKHGMVARFGAAWFEHFKSGAIRPVIDSIFDLADAPKAHRRMETGASFGKIILQVE
ncbi:MAG: NAD(P)H-quinone oxidoreductase [Novosphingobium sp.]